MWQSDSFKAKWSIIAKAYSLIRNEHGKKKVPLDTFLAINAPFVGIIAPENYLSAHGWEVVASDNGEVLLRRAQNGVENDSLHTNVSVNDVIRNSFERGYFDGDISRVLLPNDETMVEVTNNTPAQQLDVLTPAGSANTATEGTSTSSIGAENVPSITTYSAPTLVSSNAIGHPKLPQQLLAPNNLAPNITASANDTSELTQLATNDDANLLQPPLHSEGGAQLSNNAPPIFEAARSVIASSSAEPLSPANFELQGDFPFNTDFDPLSDVWTFDPFEGNEFDAFNMSGKWDEFINYDACA